MKPGEPALLSRKPSLVRRCLRWLRGTWISRIDLGSWLSGLGRWLAAPRRRGGLSGITTLRPELMQLEARSLPNDPFGLLAMPILGNGLLTPSMALIQSLFGDRHLAGQDTAAPPTPTTTQQPDAGQADDPAPPAPPAGNRQGPGEDAATQPTSTTTDQATGSSTFDDPLDWLNPPQPTGGAGTSASPRGEGAGAAGTAQAARRRSTPRPRCPARPSPAPTAGRRRWPPRRPASLRPPSTRPSSPRRPASPSSPTRGRPTRRCSSSATAPATPST